MKNISPKAIIGENVIVDDFVVIADHAQIGDNCKIHYFSFVDEGVSIGKNTKIQNNVMIPHGVRLEEGVFVGPNAVFTNDKYPRSITTDEKLKSSTDWTLSETLVKKGASIGAGAIIVCGINLGEWCMVAAGSVVTKNVPDHAMVKGNPARICGYVDKTGTPMKRIEEEEDYCLYYSEKENAEYKITKHANDRKIDL
ncbi:acyltransferase [Marinifilum sp. D737]|uniref:acyltransferase n=1 Tax=Marinifilum sp. D737 TaxID=2969628 RepID=UPI002275FFA5|nr:acyltransferase [Marinifilum sp. D737]MCY1634990.1 N-acetyltransferase [Marinifilum sp. D737]